MNKKLHPKKKQFNVRLNTTELKNLRRHAFDAEISITALVRSALISFCLFDPPTVKNKA